MVKKNSTKYLKLVIYLVVVVLLNLAGSTLFFRADLTKNGIYSLSPASREVVESLSEPLTIKVFFTKNLPSPHNATEQYLRDLLEEYAVASNRNFNYRFYNASPSDGAPGAPGAEAADLAESYGIMPVQIQAIEEDEVKFKQAYMGLALIHGDMVEKIPTITQTDRLEYDLTTAILKLNNKISAILSLKDKVKVTLYMSPSLKTVAPLMGIGRLPNLPAEMEEIVGKANRETYGKIEYRFEAPEAGEGFERLAERHDLTVINWPAIQDKGIAAGKGAIGLVMAYGGKSRAIRLLNVMRIPIIGDTYELTDPMGIEEAIGANLESLIGINRDLGYLSDHGTFKTRSFSPMGGQAPDAIGGFSGMVSRNYTLKELSLKEGLPESLNTLVIARPTEKFTDWELFQIDQALMRGTRLAIFMDAFKEEMPQQQFMGMGQGPVYRPLDTGLEKLLGHYGVRIRKSYVLDENCYKQRDPRQGGETSVYFAPIIKHANINNDLGFMKEIKGLIALQISPLELDDARIEKNGITAVRLFSSSSKSWEMKDRINLNPMFMKPPADEGEKEKKDLAYLLSGEFPSYFAGKPLPERAAPAKEGEAEVVEKEVAAEKPDADLAKLSAAGTVIEKGKPSQIFLMASSNMLRDNLIGPSGDTINATFVMNTIDALNGREEIAEMRSKKQGFNPLFDSSQMVKTFVKSFNIAGLPVVVALFGILVWVRRSARKKRIQAMFMK